MTLPARINHASALRDARQILAAKFSPASPAVRMARAYVDLHEKTTGVLKRTLERVDAIEASAPPSLAGIADVGWSFEPGEERF